VPSGDRRMARALIKALKHAGYKVDLASKLNSREPHGDENRQIQLRDKGYRLADRLIKKYAALSDDERPDLWFTYHLYYKAPDWIGPRVTAALNIPYVVAEASYAPKRKDGPWDFNLRSVADAIRQADIVFNINSADEKEVRPHLKSPDNLVVLKPFLETPQFNGQKSTIREKLAGQYGLDPAVAWLITVAMMREGAKLDSYKMLGRSLGDVRAKEWQMLVVGDGPARAQVETVLPRDQVVFTGQKTGHDLFECLSAADIFVWPAVSEAYGMALLEAQAMGLPAIAGKEGGVPDIVRHRKTGILVEPGHPRSFADAIDELLLQPELILEYSKAARITALSEHSLEKAARTMDQAIRNVLK